MYGIMRMEKFKRSACYGVCLERNREKDDGRNYARSEIDKDLTDCNIVLHGKGCKDFDEEISRQIKNAGVKERPDSVVMIGALFTASAEYFAFNAVKILSDFGCDKIAFGTENTSVESLYRAVHLWGIIIICESGAGIGGVLSNI